MDKPKIAYIIPYKFVPPKNGGQHAAYGYASYLHDIADLTCISTMDNQTTNNIHLLPLLPPSFTKYFDIRLLVPLYRWLKNNKISYVILHQPFIFFLLYPICILLKIRMGIFVQNIEYLRFKSLGKSWWPLLYIAEWISFRLSTHLLFISKDDLVSSKKLFYLKQSVCHHLPYGIPHLAPPAQDKQKLRHELGLDPLKKLIIFFGPLSYFPNFEALQTIVEKIYPVLKTTPQVTDFEIIICGGGLPSSYKKLDQHPDIKYRGFVEDINAYIQACDVMINPIITGGGVKTKLIESIGMGTPVVSSHSGAMGTEIDVCQGMLTIVPDMDYYGYAQAISCVLRDKRHVPQDAFYQHYYWGNIVKNFYTFAFNK